MNVVVRDKAEYHEQTTQRMNKHFVVPEWSDRQRPGFWQLTVTIQGSRAS
jgi:hypothetical protein